MPEIIVKHYVGCGISYPEKSPNEPYGLLVRTDLVDGEYVMQCVDCGATSLILKEKKNGDQKYK